MRDNMKDVTREVVQGDERFREAVQSHFGEAMLEYIWALVRDWFWHDFVVERIGGEDGQVWIVD